MLIAVGIVEEKRQIHVNLHSSLSQTQLNLAVLCPFFTNTPVPSFKKVGTVGEFVTKQSVRWLEWQSKRAGFYNSTCPYNFR
jgi:hypothetical protein